MSQNNILHSFTLTPASSKAIHAIPKKQKSRFVSRAILKYADDEPLNPRGQAYFVDIIGKLNERIVKLEAKSTFTPHWRPLKNGDFYVGSDDEREQSNQSDDDACPSVEHDLIVNNRVRRFAHCFSPWPRLQSSPESHTFAR